MRAKSLKYQVEKQGKGFVHRVHRSKKGRKSIRDKKLTYWLRKRKEELKLQDEE